MSDDILLTFNAGSSSLKIGIFSIANGKAVAIGRGKVDLSGDRPALDWCIDKDHSSTTLSGSGDDRFAAAVEETLHHVHDTLPGRLVAAGHRVVHGGMEFDRATRLDDDAIARVQNLVPLAPLHQPPALKAIQAVRKLHPDIRQTASFDTAFHTTQDNLVRRLAIPRKLHDEGVRRYGFHGLSYAFIVRRLQQVSPDVAHGKVIVAHLGSGASLCAIEAGKSRDTSMGFSALDGIPMATRPGWIDPGALTYIMRTHEHDPDALEDFLYHRCGLLGVSGISGDTRALLNDERPEAAEALDLFAMRISGEAARLASTLGGIDAFVFTAGIGEHQPEIRERVMRRLAWLGAELDRGATNHNASVVSTSSSRIKVMVVSTDEEQVIADEALALLRP